MSKAPSLEQRIATILNNANASAAELSELITEAEGALAAADQSITALREKATDLVAAPDAKAAFDAVQFAEHRRDRLKAALPKLRERLAAALAAERHERWRAEYERVEAGHGPLQKDMDDFHTRFADEADALEDRIAKYNRDVRRVNNFAFEIDEHHRLPRLSLWAAPVSQRRWGPPKIEGSFAASYAQSMVVPYHPGARWADPEVQEKRRAEIEQEQRRMAQYHERAAKAEEERANREERERFTALQDRKSG